jgi:glycosyltransferase involved in cell wall biosynthesis
MLSVVIIALNAERTIEKTLLAAKQVSDDIILVDSGSTDKTIPIAKSLDVQIIQTEWKGYGVTKNIGNAATRYNWILSVDADEVLSPQLISAIRSLNFSEFYKHVFNLRLLNFIGNQPLRFGEFTTDNVTRIFNKQYTRWSNDAIHETLVSTTTVKTINLKGYLQHYTSPSMQAFAAKQKKYAALMADKYYQQNKKAGFLKLYISPTVSFIKNYFFKLGFLDGKLGLQLALIYAKYTYNKYKLLANKYG